MKKALHLCLILVYFSISLTCTPDNGIVSFSEKGSSITEEKFNENWDLYYQHLDSDSDSAFLYAQEVKKLAIEGNNKKWQAKASEALAYVHFSRGHSGEAVFQYLEAAKIYDELDELYKLADVYNNLGSQYSHIKDPKTALSFFEQAKDIYDYLGTSADKAMVSRNLAICYKELKDFKKAESLLASGVEIALKGNDNLFLAEAYNTWGTVNLEQKEFQKARTHYNLAVTYADSVISAKRIKSMAINNIGESFLQEGLDTEAKKWLNKSLLEKKELNDPVLALSTYNLLGKLLIKEGKYPEAIALLEEGLQGIDSTVIDKAVGEGLTLITKALTKASQTNNIAQHAYLIEKFATYSATLSSFNNNLSGTKEQMDVISKQKTVQAAADRFAFNVGLEASEKANTQMRYAFLIPITLLLIALASVYLAVKKNRHYKKLYSNIEQVLNNSKALRHLK